MKGFPMRLGLSASFVAMALATACGSSSSPGTDAGPTSDAGNSADAGPTTYCDGFGVDDSSSDQVLVETFSYGEELKTEGCESMLDVKDGTQLTTVGGIYDVDVSDNGASTPAAALFPATCSDMGLTGTPTIANSPGTPPTGALTVEAAGNKTPAAGVAIYGVVTAIYPWAAAQGTTAAKSGSMYIEDMPSGSAAPAMNSGTQIYVDDKYATTALGTAPAIGDVVTVTNVSFSPYQGANQYSAGASTVVAKIGTSPLPPPVMLSASAVGPTSSVASSGYEGMRVQVTGGPFTVKGSEESNDCIMALEYTPSSG